MLHAVKAINSFFHPALNKLDFFRGKVKNQAEQQLSMKSDHGE